MLSFCAPCVLCLRWCYTRYTHDCCCLSIMFGAILYNRFLAGRYVGHVPFLPSVPVYRSPPGLLPPAPPVTQSPAFSPRPGSGSGVCGCPELDTHGPLLTTQDQPQSRPGKMEHNLDKSKKWNFLLTPFQTCLWTLAFGLSKKTIFAIGPNGTM